ncbi:hypothetical protein BG36_01820 [Aquamicrobium defluvii]|uniref:Uncharacterized protein n=1 Tax=Aquamicrobium defluvii TaxID=69279 RepID=A0A011UXN5_9HYPH|nr:hypothetical protein BG36_01820 [Aquamicrobium defluvii]EZQ17832.1 hypothetical protein CF98_33445 [Halopseudomonas bauzanensis]
MAHDRQKLLRDFIARQSPNFGDENCFRVIALHCGADDRREAPFHFEVASKSRGEAGNLVATATHSGNRFLLPLVGSRP